MSELEPWLRGPVDGVIAELQPAAHSLLFAQEQIERIFAQISDEQLWQTPNGAASIGYHARHFAGSALRMLTYARGESLSEQQLAELQAEARADPRLTRADVARIAHHALDAALDLIRVTDAGQLDQERFVGRKRYPSNLRGLIYEIVVHTARHVGQIATTAKVLR